MKRLRSLFNVERASYSEIRGRIISGANIGGANFIILILAILIASIGLNMNSTATVIGAMLISPLMGSIMAIGYGFATNDTEIVKRSSLGFALQVVFSLVVSTLYFSLSPISTASSELIARTSPTIWDVLIAFSGGLAGIIATTRKGEYSNVIPGVAIATALMPPLCTVGYSISVGSLTYFIGSSYLFLINVFFICLATIVGFYIMRVPMAEKIGPVTHKKNVRRIVLYSILMTIPSLFFAVGLIHQEVENKTQVAAGTSQVTNTTFDVESITKQLQVIAPKVENVKIGYLTTWDKSSSQQRQTLDVVVTSSSALDDDQKSLIKRLLKVQLSYDNISFMEQSIN